MRKACVLRIVSIIKEGNCKDYGNKSIAFYHVLQDRRV